jgi:hypothetical protein
VAAGSRFVEEILIGVKLVEGLVEVLVHGEPFLGGTWIFEDAPWCGARA